MSRERARSARAGEPLLVGDEDGDAALSRLEVGLEVDPRALEDEAAGQPALLYRAALRAARLEAQAAAAELEARAVRARVLGQLAALAENRAQPAPAAVLEARAAQHADVDAAARRAAEARRRLALARALLEAYRHRGEILVVLCGRK